MRKRIPPASLVLLRNLEELCVENTELWEHETPLSSLQAQQIQTDHGAGYLCMFIAAHNSEQVED